MSGGQVACAECGTEVPPEFANHGEFLACPACNALLRVFTFPALQRAPASIPHSAAMELGEASCFSHPQKKAVVPCDICGRFLCALCDVEMSGSHRCPACLETGKRMKSLATVENQRLLYDSLALTLALVPILIWPFTLLTAPAALYLVVRYWRRPLSILPRTKIRYLAAALIALAEIGGWAVLFYSLFAHRAGVIR